MAVTGAEVIARGRTKVFSEIPVVTTSAYAAGDVVGTKLTITDAVYTRGATGLVQSVVVSCEDDLAADDLDIIFFGTDPSGSTFTDNAALAVVDADTYKIIGGATLGEKFDTGDGCIIQGTNLALPIEAASTSEDIYAVLVCRNAFTLSAVDSIQVTVNIIQD